MFNFTGTSTNLQQTHPVFTRRFKFALCECHIQYWRVNNLVAFWHWRRKVINFVFALLLKWWSIYEQGKITICLWSNLIKLIPMAFIGYKLIYWVLKHKFWILVAHLQSTETSFSFMYVFTLSLKSEYVKLMKFLCSKSQGIQIIGNSISKISIRYGVPLVNLLFRPNLCHFPCIYK